jgi:glutathione S-transferase
MQQLACHLLSTAAVAASTATTTTASSSAAVLTAMNYLGQSKVLHLLGPPWTRTFRCIWMLEEINEEYYQQKQNTKSNEENGDQAYETSSLLSTQQQIPYYLIYNAKPLSTYVKKFHSTGKVPILLEYDINQQRNIEDAEKSATLSTILDDQNIFVLSEASAINTYLYDQYGLYSSINSQSPRRGLISSSQYELDYPLVPPVGSPLRGQYDAVISCICTELDAQGLWMHRKHDAMAQQLTGTSPNQPAVQHAKEHFKRINSYLAYLCNPYLLGAHFTAADILYIHCLQWSQSIGWSTDTWPTVDALSPVDVNVRTVEDPSASNHQTLPPPSILQPYLDLCLSRPAYQRAVQIRDRRGGDRKEDSTSNNNNNANQTTSTITGQVTTTRRTTPLEQTEQEQSNATPPGKHPTPRSKL